MTWRSELAPALWYQTALFGCAVIWFGLASPGQTARFWPTSLPGAHHALMADAMIWMITAIPGGHAHGAGRGRLRGNSFT